VAFLSPQGGRQTDRSRLLRERQPTREKAQKQIETLRRFKSIGSFGILRGRVLMGEYEANAVSHANVVASTLPDHSQFFASTDDEGEYEFPPLPPARYKIAVDPIGSFRPDNSEIQIDRGKCWDLTLKKYPHARIAGHVHHSDGSPVRVLPVLLLKPDEESWTTSSTDARGYFHFDSLRAGNYIVGIDFGGSADWKNTSGVGGSLPRATLYYPAVTDRF
jgi:Carboxypeptidase regulatory-like domain